MAKGFLMKSNLTKDTLLTIAKAGGVVFVAMVSPQSFTRIAMRYFSDTLDRAIQARARKLKELERRKLIAFHDLGGGEARIELTHRGKKLIRQYELEHMKLRIPKRWDGLWHIVTYDIPTHQRNASNAFREKLKQLGLYQLQRSIWVAPYDCLAEIEFLSTIFEINMDRHILYFHSKEIPNEKDVRAFFKLR